MNYDPLLEEGAASKCDKYDLEILSMIHHKNHSKQ